MAREICPTHAIALTPAGCLLCNRSEAVELPRRGWRLVLSLAGLAMGLGALVFTEAGDARRLRRMSLQLPSVAAMEAELAALEAEDAAGSFNVIPAPRFGVDGEDDELSEGEVIVHPETETTEQTEVFVGGRVVTEEKPKPGIKVVYVRPGPVRVVQRTRPVFYGSGRRVPNPGGFRPRYRRGDDGKFQPRSGHPRPSRGTSTRGGGRSRTGPRALPAPKVGAPR